MYKPIPFIRKRLKMTDGTTKPCLYGWCSWKLPATRLRPSSDLFLYAIPQIQNENFNKYVYVKCTTHIISLNINDIFTNNPEELSLDVDNLVYGGCWNAPDRTDAQFDTIPNLNNAETTTELLAFINGLKNPKLKQILNRIIYLITQQPTTPYANDEYQTAEQRHKYINHFIIHGNDTDDFFNNINTAALSGNNYPQAVIILTNQYSNVIKDGVAPYGYYNDTPDIAQITFSDTRTMPTMGITIDSSTGEIFHIYWTTYKGV